MSASTATIDLSVSGMSCGSCVRHVSAALQQVPGVSEAQVDLAAGRASVAYDPTSTGPEDLVAAVETAGYAATAIAPHDGAVS